MWLGQTKGIADQVVFRPLIGDDDLDDIEAEENLRVIQELQPGEGAARDELLFCAGHGFRWGSVGEAAPRFYFDENERLAGPVATNDVHLSALRCAEVAIQDLVAVPPQIPDGEAFAFAAQPLVGIFIRTRRTGAAPAERGEKFSDESDKAHARGA